jgi:hypothetical protein
MAATHEKGVITGVFVNMNFTSHGTKSNRAYVRVLIRRKVDDWRDQYDLYKPWDKINAVIEVIKVLSNEVPDFTKKILEVDERQYRQSSHRTRHYIHTEKEKLYESTRTDLVERYSRKVGNVWLGTNINTSQMVQAIRAACEAAEVEYGSLSSLKL